MQRDQIVWKRDEQRIEDLIEELQGEKERSEILELKLEDQQETIASLSTALEALKERMKEMQETKDETLRFLEKCMDDIREKTVMIITDRHKQRPTESLIAPGDDDFI